MNLGGKANDRGAAAIRMLSVGARGHNLLNRRPETANESDLVPLCFILPSFHHSIGNNVAKFPTSHSSFPTPLGHLVSISILIFISSGASIDRRECCAFEARITFFATLYTSEMFPVVKRTPTMERYSDYLFSQLDDLTSRARILRSEALRLETEKNSSERSSG